VAAELLDANEKKYRKTDMIKLTVVFRNFANAPQRQSINWLIKQLNREFYTYCDVTDYDTVHAEVCVAIHQTARCLSPKRFVCESSHRWEFQLLLKKPHFVTENIIFHVAQNSNSILDRLNVELCRSHTHMHPVGLL
jgi:hypothetical protein